MAQTEPSVHLRGLGINAQPMSLPTRIFLGSTVAVSSYSLTLATTCIQLLSCTMVEIIMFLCWERQSELCHN